LDRRADGRAGAPSPLADGLHALAEAIEEGQIHEPWLKAIEERDHIFPDLDYRIYVR
jgi:predicted glycosyl hydrolase (DUF1957 family)